MAVTERNDARTGRNGAGTMRAGVSVRNARFHGLNRLSWD